MVDYTNTNKLMRQSLEKIKLIDEKEIMGDINAFVNILHSPFVNFRGCHLLASNINMEFLENTTPACIEDKEHFEYGENHIHVKDFLVNKKTDADFLIRVGTAIAEILTFRISSCFPREKFLVVVTCDVLNDDVDLRDCVVRFYKNRGGSAILDDDLESYKYEAVGIVNIE